MERYNEYQKFRSIEDAEMTAWIGQECKYTPMTEEMKIKCEELRKQHIDACMKAINELYS